MKQKKSTKTLQKRNVPQKKIATKKQTITSKNRIKVKRRKIRFGRILLVFGILFLFFYLFSKLLSFPVQSIFVSGNTILSDQEIIELAHLEDYPNYFSYSKKEIKSFLENNIYVLKATIKKKRWKEIYIEIEENKPLFYDSSKEKYILIDKSEVEGTFSVPSLLNYVPDTLYDSFIQELTNIEEDVFYRISEIKYDPNEVDENRFLFTMNDGNYVYVTLKTMRKINHYVDIMMEVLAKYENENGILYLDEGEYFKVFQD